MSKADRFTWIIYGGIASVISFSVMAFVALTLAKSFTPQSVDMSWDESPMLLLISVPCGFAIGGLIGYGLAPKTKQERIEVVKEILFYLVVICAWNSVLSRIWNRPQAEDYFWASVAWDVGPLFLASGLLQLLRLRKRRT